MTRVNVLVEGATEEAFVNEALAPTLWERQVYLRPILIGVPGHRGGNVNYARVKRDLLTQLKQDRDALCSTMLDLYGLGRGFPGTPTAPNIVSVEKASRIEEAIQNDIIADAPDLRADIRLLPYLQVHEFEGLLFSDPIAFANGISQPNLSTHFQRIRESFNTPEEINDNPNTAPSKRVLAVHPRYRKRIDGVLAAQAVGINRMRTECPHFRNWVERLEAL